MNRTPEHHACSRRYRTQTTENSDALLGFVERLDSGNLFGVHARGSTSRQVILTLSGSEALVLSDLLAWWESNGALASLEPATRRVLNELSAVLEPTVEVAFSNDYVVEVERARSEVLRA